MDTSEQLIADSLSKHAADAPPDDQLLAGVHARLRRRRTGRSIGAAVVAAAAVATAITASPTLTARPHPEVAGTPVASWRWESFKTVEVQVPPTWTQYVSGAPCRAIPRGPVVGRFNDWLDRGSQPCKTSFSPLDERQDYVWFNAIRPAGTVRYDGGWIEETRLIAGVTVSVLTRDAELRERILNTARPIEGTDHYGCTPTDPGKETGTESWDSEVTAIDVCEYYQGSLVAGSALPPKLVAQYAHMQPDPRSTPPVRLPTTPAVNRCSHGMHVFVFISHTRTTTWSKRSQRSPCEVNTNPDSPYLQGPHKQSPPLAHLVNSPSPR